MIIFLAVPKIDISTFSNDIPNSGSKTSAFVKIPISSNWLFLLLPNPGVLTHATLNTPLSLFNIKAAKGSDSTSSATITNGLFAYAACSKNL